MLQGRCCSTFASVAGRPRWSRRSTSSRACCQWRWRARRAAAATGLVAGTPVIAGGSDNAAAAVGLDAVDPGVLTLSIGTSGVLFAPLDRYPDAVDGRVHVFCHALPGRWHLMAVTLSAG